MIKKLYISLFSLLLAFIAVGQDAQFSQFYAAPLYLNPAFTGTNLKTRANFIYRNQWASLPGSFVTYSAAVDYNLESFNSGFGLIMTSDKAGAAAMKSTNVSLLYSYNLQVNNKFVIRAGLQFGFNRNSINYNDLIFGSQINADNGVTGAASGENLFGKQNKSMFDFSSGVLGYTDKYWIGLSAHHLNQPDLSFEDGDEAPLPLKVSIHGGAKLQVVQGEYTNDKRVIKVSPAFMYKAQGKFDQLDLGFYVNYNPVVLGLWYRGIPVLKQYEKGYANNDAISAVIGFHQDYLTIGYSYDFTISRLGPATGGSHEISIGYEFYYKTRKKKIYEKYIPCPKF